MKQHGKWAIICAAVVGLHAAASPAFARVRLANICTVQGQQEIKLIGYGLVIGLPGTGDGAKNDETVQAMRAALSRLNHPTEAKLKNADNVAIVVVEASIPKSGIRRGQQIDGYISSLFGAKSLRGGRLLSTPLSTLDGRNQAAVALAAGAVTVEDIKLATTARLASGVDVLRDVTSLFVKQVEDGIVTLLITPEKASFWTASEVASVINTEFTFEAQGNKIAKAVGPGAVEVKIPETYRKEDELVEFVAQVLEVGIDNPHTQARVTLNAQTGVVIVTGEVEISPVMISHKNFNIEIGADADETPSRFFAVAEGGNRQSPVQLQQLQSALKQLRVPPADIIAIIRELHSTGKLHAELIEK